LQLARDTSENRVAVIHLADNQCTNQGQQGMLQITLSKLLGRFLDSTVRKTWALSCNRANTKEQEDNTLAILKQELLAVFRST